MRQDLQFMDSLGSLLALLEGNLSMPTCGRAMVAILRAAILDAMTAEIETPGHYLLSECICLRPTLQEGTFEEDPDGVSEAKLHIGKDETRAFGSIMMVWSMLGAHWTGVICRAGIPGYSNEKRNSRMLVIFATSGRLFPLRQRSCSLARLEP